MNGVVARARATIDDVAATARVSRATVSNVLRHPERVRASTRLEVLAAVDRLGYRPNHAARIVGGRPMALVAVVGDLRDPYALPAFAVIDGAAAEVGLLAQFMPRAAADDRNPAGLGMMIALAPGAAVSGASARIAVRGLMTAAACPDHPLGSTVVRLEEPSVVRCEASGCRRTGATGGTGRGGVPPRLR